MIRISRRRYNINNCKKSTYSFTVKCKTLERRY
jgi:hypothetical protein